MPNTSQLANFIKETATDLGFDITGVSPVEDFPELNYFPNWIAESRQGDMHYLESRNDHGELKRSSLKHAAPWARSAIVCALNYNTDQPYSTETANNSTSGWISRYAWGQRDYHDVILPRLRELEGRLRQFAGDIQTWSYVDTGPIIERVFANHAGIGWTGKNACIINEKLGSWLFLGVILTSIEIQPDLPPPDRCGTCTRCLEACPTDAFIEPHKLDASRCISYLTIEKRGALPEPLRDGIGRHVFGCDICQDVCPWNNKGRHASKMSDRVPPPSQSEGALSTAAPSHTAAPSTISGAAPFPKGGCATTAEPAFQPRPKFVNPPFEWLATITEEDFTTTFRGSPVKRTKRSGIRRNAIVAMGNSGNPDFIRILREIADHDPDEVIAEHARWAITKLKSEAAL